MMVVELFCNYTSGGGGGGGMAGAGTNAGWCLSVMNCVNRTFCQSLIFVVHIWMLTHIIYQTSQLRCVV